MLKLLPKIASVASIDFEEEIARQKRNVGLYAFSALLLMSAWGVSIAAGALALAPHVGGLLFATLYIAGGLFLLALTIAMMVGMMNSAHKRKRRMKFRDSAAYVSAQAIAATPQKVRSQPLMALLAVAGLSFAAVRMNMK